MTIPKEYPFKAPTITWVTPIFHPNIQKLTEKDSGYLCLPLITGYGKWNPAMKLHESNKLKSL